MFPLIPILALLGIVGGIATLSWYSTLSAQEKDRANRVAMNWFGKRFQELSEYQQEQVRKKLDNRG
jgi:hypothetical protein